MLVLETERLILKPHTLANVEKLNTWENDPELLYYNDDQPEDREQDTLEETSIIRYAIHRKEDDNFIDYRVIAFIDHYHRLGRLGITIGEKAEWGKGYAKEAFSAVINYCFQILDLNRVGVEVYSFNARSMRLFEGLGFQREGVIRQAVWKKGVFADEVVYGLLKEE